MNAVLTRLRRRLSFANVTAATALFVALGGTSYAAINLPENSVGTREIRTGGVGKSEIQTGGVGSAEIHTGAVRKAEIKTGGVGAAELHTDSVRAKEIKGGSVKTEELSNDSVTGDKIAKDAVTADEIKDGTVGMNELDAATKGAIAAAPLRADVNAGGGLDGGTAKSVAHTNGSGVYTIDFGTNVSKCTAVASLSNVDAASAGAATAAPGSAANTVEVHTFKPGTTTPTPTAGDLPFHVIVAC